MRKRKMSFVITVLICLASFLAADARADHDAFIRLEQPRIYGGEATEVCGWPTAVAVSVGCTGTLVHPQIVISAAHCFQGGGGGNAQIAFGNRSFSPEKNISASCTANPQYDGFSAQNDISFCKLSQAVNDIPITPILMGCETSVLQTGKEVTIVGFGESDNNLPQDQKQQVTTTINSVQNGELGAGGNGKDSCYGDSGGPVYVQLDDGTWRVTGITSYGGECGGGGFYSMMHNNVDWVEQASGVDITPCFDANGTWNPGSDCANAPLDPAADNGTWDVGCSGGDEAPADFCFSGGADTDADSDSDADSDGDSDIDSDSDSDGDSDGDDDDDDSGNDDDDDNNDDNDDDNDNNDDDNDDSDGADGSDSGCGCSPVGEQVGFVSLLPSIVNLIYL